MPELQWIWACKYVGFCVILFYITIIIIIIKVFICQNTGINRVNVGFFVLVYYYYF